MALSLVDSVKLDLFQSGLTIEWLSELQRRLFELLSVVQLCVDRYGEDRVLFNDGFR